MNTQKPSQEVSLHPLQIAQEQVGKITKLINGEVGKLVLHEENRDRDYGKIFTEILDHIITEIPNAELQLKNIKKNINIFFSKLPEGNDAADKFFNLDQKESHIIINQLKHFIKNLDEKRDILEKEITYNQEHLAIEMLRQYKPEIYQGLMNNDGELDLDETDGYLPTVEKQNLPLADHFIIKNVNEAARRIKIYKEIADEVIKNLNLTNPIKDAFEQGIENIYKQYLDMNTVFENSNLENKYPSKDKAFLERQWLENDSIIDEAGEEMYLGKLKKHWNDYLSERKELVKHQEFMNIPEDKKIIAREKLFDMNYEDYDLTLDEFSKDIKKDIKANKQNYNEEVEDYKSEGHPDQYDEQGKILALNPTTKQDLIKNYYILRAAEFFLQK